MRELDVPLKRMSEVRIDRLADYAQIVQWRMWHIPSNENSDISEEIIRSMALITAKQQAIISSELVDGDKYRVLAKKYIEKTETEFHPPLSPLIKDSFFLLEPLSDIEAYLAKRGMILLPFRKGYDPRAILLPGEFTQIVEI